MGDFQKERMIISVAWKWLGGHKVESASIPKYYGYKNVLAKNKKLVELIHSLFSAADILVAQNGDAFDIKRCNSEFIKHGLKPPSTYKSVDTLKVARQKFGFNSNKLDDIGATLGLGRKKHTGGFKLWQDCINGNRKAWNKMIAYNEQDVVLLEKIYLKLRPWMTTHPNMNAIDGGEGCTKCRSNNLNREGFTLSNQGRRQRYSCKDCGNWMASTMIMSGNTLR